MNEIPDRQEALNAFAATFLMLEPKPNGHVGGKDRTGYVPTDEEVLRAARKAKNAAKFSDLFDAGDLSAYGGDESRADQALASLLAYWTQDPEQITRLIRSSALDRPKWRRRDYRERTIRFALDNVRETFNWSWRTSSGPSVTDEPQRNSVSAPNRERYAITLKRLKDVPPPGPLRYVVADLVPEGFATLIYGDGGVAKSMLAMSLATAISSSTLQWLGRELLTAPVVYADFELDEGEQRRRGARLARGALMEDMPDDLHYICAVGEPPERFLNALLEACVESGVKVVVLDSLGMALAGDPQSPTDVIGFHKRCIDPFRAKGITVIIVDHQSKTLAGERYQDKRAFGTVYKENCARSVLQVQPQQRGKGMLRVKVRQTKANFGSEVAPFGIELRFSEEQVTVERFAVEAGDLVDERTMNIGDKVILYLKDESAAFPKDIAKDTGSAYQSVKNEVSRLRREGLVEDTGEKQGQAREVRLTASGLVAASEIASRDYIGGDYASMPETKAGADEPIAEEF